MERKNRLLLILTGFAVLIGLLIFMLLVEPRKASNTNQSKELSQSDISSITYKGEKYHYNQNMLNVLVFGIRGQEDETNEELENIVLFSFNKETNEGKMMEIPCNTIAAVKRYDESGNLLETIQAEIVTQYVSAVGRENSCLETKKAVSRLLYDLPIDAYLAADLNELESVVEQIKVQLDEGKDIAELYSVVMEHVTTDLTLSQMNTLREQYGIADIEKVIFPGKEQSGKDGNGFYANEELLQEMLIQNYYNLKK